MLSHGPKKKIQIGFNNVLQCISDKGKIIKLHEKKQKRKHKLELEEFKNNSMESKCILVLKLPRFLPQRTGV